MVFPRLRVIAATALLASAIASILPANVKRAGGVPPPNPLPDIVETVIDFDVRHLEAQAVTMSERNYISFHVRPYPKAHPSHCFALGTTLTHTLTTIPQTWCYPSHNNDATTAPNPDDHVWFTFILGDDVNPNAPTSDGIFGMHQTTGAYLKIVRQVDEHTHDEAMQYFPENAFDMRGEGAMAHEVYNGPENLSIVAVRYGGVAH